MPTIGKKVLLLVLGLFLLTLLAALPAAAEGIPITRIADLGGKVFLKDGSVWRIDDPDEQQMVYENWLPAQTVVPKLKKGWNLWNYNTGQSVSAHRTKAAQKRAPVKGESTAWPRIPAQPSPAQNTNQLGKRLNSIEKRLESIEKRLQRLEMGIR